MKVLRWLDRHFEETIMLILLAMIVVVMGIQVVMRYGLKSSLVWAEELSRYFFIWFVFMGISYGVRQNIHIKVDIIETVFPRTKRILGVLQDIAFLVFSVYMIQPGFKAMGMLIASGQKSPAMGVPMYLVYISLMGGFLLTIMRMIQKYVLLLAGKGDKKE